MVTILLDPAHGGTVQHGKSTPAGRTLLDGSNEKAATWELAQRVLTQLGSGVGLTRAGEDNPSLAQRIAGARDSEAKVFVSIHARSTGPAGNGSRGHETWIHTQGSFSSLALARAIARELGSVGANGQVYRGELAVLTPNLHAPDTAACLVEVDVGLGTDLDGASAAIARAVQSFLGGGQPVGLGLRRRQRTGRGLSVVTPAYGPQSDQEAMAAFEQWQADANNFLIGVPPGAHDYFPHCAIAHLQLHFSDGSSGGGTGFFVAEDLVLTAAHCLFDIATGAYLTSVEVYPGQANNTPANSFTVSGAGDVFRTHSGYNGDASFDLGLIRAPRGQYAGPYFQAEEQNQSYTPGTILVCGYAARLTAKDQEVLQMCAAIDRNVQHLSADTIQQLIENEQAFTYSLQTLAGTSGAPVFFAAEGAAHAIGVHHGANDATTNKGCRLTQEKIQWIHGSWSGSQWPPAAGYGRRGLGAVRQPARPGGWQPAPPQRRPAPPANVRYGTATAGFPQPPGASEVYGRPTAAPRRAARLRARRPPGGRWPERRSVCCVRRSTRPATRSSPSTRCGSGKRSCSTSWPACP
jgi:V8-like Glu-specific endopeptidase